MEHFVTEFTWFIVGYLGGCFTFLFLIFWNDFVHRLTDFFSLRKFKRKTKLLWWEIKYFVNYRILRK